MFNESNVDLLDALIDKKRVKIVLTGAWCPYGDGSVSVPDYTTLCFKIDEIVMFTVPSAPGSVFMGKVTYIGSTSKHYGRAYNVSCIPRPSCRGGARDINFLKHANVTRSQILCKLIKGPKLYPKGQK